MGDDRCTALDHVGHRCQLFAGHHGHDHAALVFTGPWVYSRGTGKTRPRKVIRWGDDGESGSTLATSGARLLPGAPHGARWVSTEALGGLG
jgi:hypothetical protein